MLTMTAERWFYLLALCLMCVSSNQEYFFEDCDKQKLSAPLGSSVLLPCKLTKSSLEWVSWVQTPEVHLVNLTSEGRIKFLEPRNGRVKAFPNRGSEGNYSICIDELQNSDQGSYRCKQGLDCLEVKLVVVSNPPSKDKKQLIYIFVGVAALILLSACGYCCIKYILVCNDRKRDHVNYVGAGTKGASASPEEPGREPVDWQQQGADHDNPVYENDDHDPAYIQENPTRNNCILPGFVHHLEGVQPTQSTSGIYPNLNQSNFERTESKRTKQRFHRELISRLRPASLSRHYYVNQAEISQQQAASSHVEKKHRGHRKNKTKENIEYKNPIYNRSTDHLNQL